MGGLICQRRSACGEGNIGETCTGQVRIDIAEAELKLTYHDLSDSALDTSGESFLKEFSNVFESIRNSDPAVISTWKSKMVELMDSSRFPDIEPIDTRVLHEMMGSSNKRLYITYGLIAINLVVFAAMLVNGVDFLIPTAADILQWGGNLLPVTSAGEWWRVLTCVFVHIGVIHLVLNMYVLFMLGGYLEPMLGKTRFLAAYLSTGIFASLVSLWWHTPPIVSAGASGAIFGMFGVFLALLTTNLIPVKARNQMLKGIGILVVYNLVYGMRSGIDNAAHIGGLLSGLLVGYIYFLELRKKEARGKTWLQPTLILLSAIVASFIYLNSKKVVSKRDDSEKFSRSVEHFSVLEELALDAMMSNDTTGKDAFLHELKKTALVDWAECVNLMEDAERLELPEYMDDYRLKLLEYSNQRLQQTLLFIRATEEDTEKYNNGIDSIQTRITKVLNELKEKGPIEKSSEPPVDL